MRSLMFSLVVAIYSYPAIAQEEEENELGWSNVADVSYVVTAGNSATSTFALDNQTTHAWENADFTVALGALRTKTADARFAVGAPGDFVIVEDDTRELDNERYYVNVQYQRNLSERFFWLVGGGWDRDRNQGIDSRTVLFGGLGNTWVDRERTKLETNYSVTFTRRLDLIPDPERDERFSEARLSSVFMHKLGDSHQVDNNFAYFFRLDEVSDNRFNTTSSITSNLNQMIALRFALQFLYQNVPALESIALFDPSGASLGTVAVRKEKLDTVVKFSFVVTL